MAQEKICVTCCAELWSYQTRWIEPHRFRYKSCWCRRLRKRPLHLLLEKLIGFFFAFHFANFSSVWFLLDAANIEGASDMIGMLLLSTMYLVIVPFPIQLTGFCALPDGDDDDDDDGGYSCSLSSDTPTDRYYLLL